MSVSTNAGATATFQVGVSGTPTVTYQWFFNGDLIQNATDATLTLTHISSGSAGAYSVTAWQVLGPEDEFEAASDPATLTVNYKTSKAPIEAAVWTRRSISFFSGLSRTWVWGGGFSTALRGT
jgi:hypothetical protein